MISWPKKKKEANLRVDIHSHLIPSIDDGVRTVDESLQIVKEFVQMGLKKAVTTPHIHPNYPNTPNGILDGLSVVQEKIREENISFELEAAAEYYVDDIFFHTVRSGGKILTFGENHVLVESSFMNKPLFFESCLFELQAKGFKPVLAHPERYRFLEGEIDWLIQLKEAGVLFQVTLSSFVGYYGTIPRKIAKELFSKGMIDFLGSDLHRAGQLKYMQEGMKQKEVEKLCKSSSLKNATLL